MTATTTKNAVSAAAAIAANTYNTTRNGACANKPADEMVAVVKFPRTLQRMIRGGNKTMANAPRQKLATASIAACTDADMRAAQRNRSGLTSHAHRLITFTKAERTTRSFVASQSTDQEIIIARHFGNMELATTIIITAKLPVTSILENAAAHSCKPKVENTAERTANTKEYTFPRPKNSIGFQVLRLLSPITCSTTLKKKEGKAGQRSRGGLLKERRIQRNIHSQGLKIQFAFWSKIAESHHLFVLRV